LFLLIRFRRPQSAAGFGARQPVADGVVCVVGLQRLRRAARRQLLALGKAMEVVVDNVPPAPAAADIVVEGGSRPARAGVAFYALYY
jgi:hypothetical protein